MTSPDAVKCTCILLNCKVVAKIQEKDFVIKNLCQIIFYKNMFNCLGEDILIDIFNNSLLSLSLLLALAINYL